MVFGRKPKIYMTNYIVCKKDSDENPERTVYREMFYYRELCQKLHEASLATIPGSHTNCDFEDSIPHIDEVVDSHPENCNKHTYIFIMPNNISVHIRPLLWERVWAKVDIRRISKKEPKYIEETLKDTGQIIGKYDGNKYHGCFEAFEEQRLIGEFLAQKNEEKE